MKSLDEMPANDVIRLYYEKHDAIRSGNMIKLIELKKQYPELFDKEKDTQIYDMIEYAKAFQASARYKELHKMLIKEKLSIISNPHFE